MTDWYEEIDKELRMTRAVIRKVGNEFCIFSKKGKKLSCHKTRKEALKRLRQIEFFKNRGEDED